jgi:hypothetical protein
MKKNILFIVVVLASVSTTILISRSFRVAQIPNGGKFSCANCHVDPFGGGPRNSFGQAVENGFLNNQGQVIWNSSLASLDSDGDGTSNGAELQDPSGSWRMGNNNPGNLSLVTNPGDPTSKPNPTSVANQNIPTSYKLLNNYPNPFNPSTIITFEIPQAENVLLAVYNINGELIRTLANKNYSAGSYKVVWNGKDDIGNNVSSGIYIYRIIAGQFDKSSRMVLLK